jgi:polar amino acid transport system substrate-binding protein
MTSATVKWAALGSLALAIAATCFGAAAQTGDIDEAETPITCGTIYEVQKGDWLNRLALRAYGEANYIAIYRANRDVLPDMSYVTVGVRLLIPCLDGTGPKTRAEAKAIGMLDIPRARKILLAEPRIAATAQPAEMAPPPADTLDALPVRDDPADAPAIAAAVQLAETAPEPVSAFHSPPIEDEPITVLAVAAAEQPVEAPSKPTDGFETPPVENDASTGPAVATVVQRGAAASEPAGAFKRAPVTSGAAPASAFATVVQPVEPASDATGSAGIRLLSGRNFAPFADPGLPEGGMIADLVRRSVDRAAPGRQVRVSFEDDWSLHLKKLKSGEFDVGSPWFMPDCARAHRLTGTMQEICNGIVFSRPLFEVAMRFYVRPDDPLAQATVPAVLFGKRICRPADQFTFDLEQAGLWEPNVTRVIPPTSGDCFSWLARGEVDVVSVSERTAEEEISYLGLEGRVIPIDGLKTMLTLHVVAAEKSPEGRAYIDLVDQGLGDLQISGQWFEVVARHLGAYAVSTR